MLADWIGSDTRLFPYSHSLDGMRMSFARDSAATALKDLGLNVDASERTDDQGRTSFRRVCPSDSAPRSSQAALLGLPAESGGSISVLEAETGSGKTEAALARFVDLFEEGLVDGMYFALPTRTAATQMHARVRVAAQRAFPHPPAVVLAVPGYLRVDDADGERQRLPSFDVQWPDQDRYRYRGWPAENAKRFLVGCIVVGTVDQVLLSALMVNHAHLRATALLRHLLVVDEVHASDAYMVRVLENVLARHLASGGHALLLSATLGGEARQRLLDPTGRVQGLSLADAIGTPYPLVSYQSQSAGCISVTAGGASRDIHLTTQPWMSEPALVAEAARDMAARGAKVLVIRNTVRDCIATQMELESLTGLKGEDHLLFGVGDHPAPHHARFARVDRHLLDKAIEESFGGNRRAGGLVCVATQTVQQSLDLDADVMLTDLCPADVLLQRIGRLHRHDRSRPVGFAEAAAVVMVPECRDLEKLIRDDGTVTPHHGLGSVYADLRIMEATWRLFEAHVVWAVPAMNRTLVENCVHSEVTSMIGEQAGARWRQHGIQVEGRLRAQARLAQLNLVDWSVPYETMSFPDSSSQRIPTRLGEGDRTAAFPEPVPGPFGHLIGEITVPGWMAHEVPTDAETENVSAAGGAIQFTFGGRRFRYDRHGLRTDEA
jgi:CRISPR-associated endonuclease/helicase Cas3